MTDKTQEIKPGETTPPVAPQEPNKEEDKKPADPPATSASEEIKEPEVDYKVETEKLQNQVKQAEHTIETVKKENKDLKNVQPNADEIKETVKETVKEVVKEEMTGLRQDNAKDNLEDELQKIENPDERALTKLHYEKTIQKTGFDVISIKNDVEIARSIANRKTITKTVENLEDKVASNEAITNSGGGSSPVKTKPEPKIDLTPGEQAALTRMNARRIANGNPELTSQEFKQKVAGQGDSVVSSSSVA